MQRKWFRTLLGIYCVLVLMFLTVPLVVIFPLSVSSADFFQFPPPGYSLRWYEAFFASQAWLASVYLSVKVAMATTILALLLGIPVAFHLARSRNRLVVWVVDKAMVTPIVIPGMVAAIAVYGLLSSHRLIGTFFAMVLGHLILALPFVVIVMTAALKQFDRLLEDAAEGLGAGKLRAILLVTFPLTRASIFTAAFFAFMASFDDLVIALFISGSNSTLPKKTFENIGYALDPTIAVVSTMQIGLLIVASASWYVVVGRRSSKLFG